VLKNPLVRAGIGFPAREWFGNSPAKRDPGDNSRTNLNLCPNYKRVIMLPDVLGPNMKIIFCGTAVSNKSVKEKAYYSERNNRFWEILHKIRLTPMKLNPKDFRSVRNYGLGLTDLVKSKAAVDSELKVSDYNTSSLTRKIKRLKPKVLCFNGKKTAKIYLKRKRVNYGFQNEKINSTRIFIALSTSGNATKYWDENYWFLLKKKVHQS